MNFVLSLVELLDAIITTGLGFILLKHAIRDSRIFKQLVVVVYRAIKHCKENTPWGVQLFAFLTSIYF